MIKGMHAMFFSDDPEATRAFIRDKLQVPGKDTGQGWWIFDFQEGDMGVHPVDHEGSPPTGTHDISFYCDDLQGEVARLQGLGVEFVDDISDQGYAQTIHFTMPGNVKCELYEPRYK